MRVLLAALTLALGSSAVAAEPTRAAGPESVGETDTAAPAAKKTVGKRASAEPVVAAPAKPRVGRAAPAEKVAPAEHVAPAERVAAPAGRVGGPAGREVAAPVRKTVDAVPGRPGGTLASPPMRAGAGTVTRAPDSAPLVRKGGTDSPRTLAGGGTHQPLESAAAPIDRGRPGIPGTNGIGPRSPLMLDQVTPLHGIFLYGPTPSSHSSYTGGDSQKIARRDLPDRQLDRGGSLAVGLLGGAYISSTTDGNSIFGDPGAGLNARFRPVEFLGIQAGVQHSIGWTALDVGEDLRQATLGTASLQLFAFPWSHVSPFATAGAGVQDGGTSLLGNAESADSPLLWGPHAGLGLEIAIGKSVAIDLDGRYNYLVNAAANGAVSSVVTTNVGLLFHF